MRNKATLGALAVGLALAGCSAPGSSGTSGGTSGASATIGPAGGRVAASDGTAVDLPAGALASDTVVTISPGSGAPAGASAVGSTYVLGPEGTRFAQPVTVTLAYAPDRLGGSPASAVRVFTAPAGSSSFSELATTAVDATHVRASVSHFSAFVPAVSAAAADGGPAGPCNAPGGPCCADGSCAADSRWHGAMACVSGSCCIATGGTWDGWGNGACCGTAGTDGKCH